MTARHVKTLIVDWRRVFFYAATFAVVALCLAYLPFKGAPSHAGSLKHAVRGNIISSAACYGCDDAHPFSADTTSVAPLPEAARPSRYSVRSGDTLTAIARRFYGHADDWGYLFHVNEKTITDANLIYVGQTLILPVGMPKGYKLSGYLPKPVKIVKMATATAQPLASPGGSLNSSSPTGTLSCSALQHLWDSAGGNPADAFIAAEIGMAESGGNQYAADHDADGTVDEGYWQINSSNGALATYNAYGNARSAIILSHDGTDWSPWVTYQTGAYSGLC